MRGSTYPWRLALFCGAALALVCGAVVFSDSGGEPVALPPPAVASRPMSAPPGRTSTGGLRVQARRFLGVFFRYEVGELDASGRRVLRRTATPGFAAALLRERPRSGGRDLRTAHLARVSLSALPSSPTRALISGSAMRGRSAEQFSFLFELRGGVWQASGPGQ